MSVSNGFFIFCEGTPHSYDIACIQKITSGNCVVVAAGGKQGINSFVRGYLSRKNDPKYLIFRDRDFDVRPPEPPQMIRAYPNRKIYCTHRACIENYLLTADTIFEYWCFLRNSPNKEMYGEPPAIEEIQRWLCDAARSIQDYQAARWALASLKPNRWPQIATTWTDGSGKLPTDLDRESCKSKALSLITQYQEESKVEVSAFLEAFDAYSHQFSQSSFWEKEAYLIWFHGKDLLKAMNKLNKYSISLKDCMKWAVEEKHLNTPDFKELEQMISKMSSS